MVRGFPHKVGGVLMRSGKPEGARRFQLEDHDPAFTIPLKAFIIESLQTASQKGMGPYWEKADEGTKKSLEKFLS